MQYFYAGAELRWVMASTDWPDTEEFRDLMDTFNQVYQDAARGTRVVDILGATSRSACSSPSAALLEQYQSLEDVRLNRDIYHRLIAAMNRGTIPDGHAVGGPIYTTYDSQSSDDSIRRASPHARELWRLEVDGVLYGTRDKNIRNSFICFRDPCSREASLLRAGQISQIFLHRHVSLDNRPTVAPFIVVDEYAPLSSEHAAHDPYARFPMLNTFLCYDRFQPTRRVIRPTDILYHFAALHSTPEAIAEPCIVVRTLDRVSLSVPYIVPRDAHFFLLELVVSRISTLM